jgi:hypothetical protein
MNSWIRVIHVAKREVGIDDESYRNILQGCAGVDTAKDIKTVAQFKMVMHTFEKLGFRRQKQPQKRLPVNESERGKLCTERQRYYIKGLWELASNNKDEKSLHAMLKRIAHVDDLRFLDKKNASAVILALRDITQKAGFDPDGPSEG